MPPKSWLKQNGPPPTVAPLGAVADPQLVSVSSSPMNMYSPLRLQLSANAHSTPPPSVHVVTVSLTEVEMSQLPHPAATVLQVSSTEARTGTNAAPPLA